MGCESEIKLSADYAPNPYDTFLKAYYDEKNTI